jgi:hypothetical protein
LAFALATLVLVALTDLIYRRRQTRRCGLRDHESSDAHPQSCTHTFSMSPALAETWPRGVKPIGRGSRHDAEATGSAMLIIIANVPTVSSGCEIMSARPASPRWQDRHSDPVLTAMHDLAATARRCFAATNCGRAQAALTKPSRWSRKKEVGI